MRIGFVELLLILLIASLTIGPSAALWVDRWLRRANRASAAALFLISAFTILSKVLASSSTGKGLLVTLFAMVVSS